MCFLLTSNKIIAKQARDTYSDELQEMLPESDKTKTTANIIQSINMIVIVFIKFIYKKKITCDAESFLVHQLL